MSEHRAPVAMTEPDMEDPMDPSTWPHPSTWDQDMDAEEMDRKVKLYMQAHGMVVLGPNGEVYNTFDKVKIYADKKDAPIQCTRPAPYPYIPFETGIFSLNALAATADTFNNLSREVAQLEIDAQMDLLLKPQLELKNELLEQVHRLRRLGHDQNPFVPWVAKTVPRGPDGEDLRECPKIPEDTRPTHEAFATEIVSAHEMGLLPWLPGKQEEWEKVRRPSDHPEVKASYLWPPGRVWGI